jgi:hypothetical protein
MGRMNQAELKWLPIPLDLWIPAGLKDFQEGWFVNLLRASLRSENMGYLVLCEEGCSGCPACLWRVANAHHPEYFKKHCSLVLACFNGAQIAGRRVLYFPKLVETIKGQLSKIKNHRSRRVGISETSTGLHKEGGYYSPSDSLYFDFDLDSKNKKKESDNSSFEVPTMAMREERHFSSTEIEQGARRIMDILGLPESSLHAGMAAVEAEAKRTRSSMDGIVQCIATGANHAERLGVSQEEFLEDFLAQTCARQVLGVLNLPITNNFTSRLTAVIKAEAKDTGLPLQEAANRITQAASEDRLRGQRIDIFYFEDVKWRSNGRLNKAEQRKINNLEVNARVKQRLRERFGSS